MAQEAWRAYLELAQGVTEATRKKATKAVKRLVGKSAMTAEQLQSMAEDLLRASTENRDALTKLVRYELDRALGAVGLATADEVTSLTTRVRELEARLRDASAGESGSAGSGLASSGLAGSGPVSTVPDTAAEIAKVTAASAPVAVAARTAAKKVAKKTTSLVPAPSGAAATGVAEPAAPPVVKRVVAKKAVAKKMAKVAKAAAEAKSAPGTTADAMRRGSV